MKKPIAALLVLASASSLALLVTHEATPNTKPVPRLETPRVATSAPSSQKAPSPALPRSAGEGDRSPALPRDAGVADRSPTLSRLAKEGDRTEASSRSFSRPVTEARANAADAEEARENQRRAKEVLSALASGGVEERIAALKLARDEAVPGVASAIARAALEDPEASVRLYAVQALALDDYGFGHRDVFVKLLNADDWRVRANATLGLARAGDEHAEQDLVALAERLDAERSPHAAAIARAAASPELCAERTLAYFRARAEDPRRSRDEHTAALEALAAKGYPR